MDIIIETENMNSVYDIISLDDMGLVEQEWNALGFQAQRTAILQYLIEYNDWKISWRSV